MESALPKPQLDSELVPEFAALLSAWPESIEEFRSIPLASIDDQLSGRAVTWFDAEVPCHDGAKISATVFRRKEDDAAGPGFYFIHGGGMIMGDSSVTAPMLADLVERHGGTGVAINYRLAPEFPDPYPVEDCYSGLRWLADSADDLGVDLDRLIIMGQSAGGGLAAGTCLLARDRGGPTAIGQLLMCPMLDDRDNTFSTKQFDGTGGWDRADNQMGWDALLGDRRAGDSVSQYAAPSRATDLANLPSTFVDCGSAEVFRDEDVDYAMRLAAAGGQVELHVWAGGFHGYESVTSANVSKATVQARNSWVDRILHQGD